MKRGQTLQMQESEWISLIPELHYRPKRELVHTLLPRDSADNKLMGANWNFKLKMLPEVIEGGEQISLARCCARFSCLQINAPRVGLCCKWTSAYE
jgi:hypothetical protein